MNILDAINDLKIFGQHFKGGSWNNWIVFLCALFALPMTPEQLAIYQKHTGRKAPPTEPFQESWLIVGRRGGKSFILATIAVFLAIFRDWRPHLAAGEYGTVMVICQERKQARSIMRFCVGLLESSSLLKRQIVGKTATSITLKNRIVIEVHVASMRSTRGYTVVAALLDEIAFWPVDETSAKPDIEVVNAIRPAMATVPGSILLAASSPYARRGALWDTYRRYHGKDQAPTLTWQADTRSMNSSVPQSYIDRHYEEDPARAAAEYGAEFRSDLESFVSEDAVRACVSRSLRERLPLENTRYFAFVDPSGGGADSFTMAIAHKQADVTAVDVLREVKTRSPESVVEEYCELLRTYKITAVTGDHYAGEWPRQAFRKHGVEYVTAMKPKSDLYVGLLPVINSGKLDLLDHPKAIAQLCALERKTARSGKDSIDHPPNGHDDLANVIAGVVSEVRRVTDGSMQVSLFGPRILDGRPMPNYFEKPSPPPAPPKTYSREELLAQIGAAANNKQKRKW
jgi:hypothetical protein